MKKETIDQLYKEFEQYALEVNGVECWSARELQELLGYSKWETLVKFPNWSDFIVYRQIIVHVGALPFRYI